MDDPVFNAVGVAVQIISFGLLGVAVVVELVTLGPQTRRPSFTAAVEPMNDGDYPPDVYPSTSG